MTLMQDIGKTKQIQTEENINSELKKCVVHVR